MLMKGLIYLFTGKLNERKGIMPLLTAWMVHVMKYPNDSLVVVGSGELYDVCNNIYGKVPSVYIEGLYHMKAFINIMLLRMFMFCRQLKTIGAWLFLKLCLVAYL